MRLLTTMLLCLFAGSMLLLQQLVSAQCSSTVTRKEFRQMTTTERTKYFNAIKLLNTGTRPNQFDRFAQIHVYFAGQIHGYAPFFPFHRQFLRDWEQTLQRVSGDNTIYQPFWNWASDSQNPQGSPIFTATWLGGNSNGGCASIPSLGGQWQIMWNGNYQQQLRCLVRNFDQNSMRAYYSQSALQTILTTATTYGAFGPAIEGGPHGNVHISIGGTNGDMSGMASPNDPFFWFHHAFIDKLWNDWMNLNIGARQWDYSGRNQNGASASYYDSLPYYGNAVWTVMPLGNMCYNYASGPSKRDGAMDMAQMASRSLPPPPPPPAAPGKKDPAAPVGGSLNIARPGAPPMTQIAAAKMKDNIPDLVSSAPSEFFIPRVFQPMKPVAPLPEWYIKMNNLDTRLTRLWERRLTIHINNVNFANGFKMAKVALPMIPPEYTKP